MDEVVYQVYKNTSSEFRWAVKPSELQTFLNDLISGSVTKFWADSLFQSSSDYVVSIMYYPIKIEKFTDLYPYETALVVGKKTTSARGHFLYGDKIPMIKLFAFNLNAYKLGNFLDYSPYTSISLHIPYFEPIELEPNIAYKMYTIEVYMCMDLTNGKSTIYIQGKQTANSSWVLLATKTSQLGIEIAMGKSNKEGQILNNALQTISLLGGIGGATVGVASGNPLVTAGSIGMLTRNATQFLGNNVDRLKSYKGSNGDRTSLMVDKRCYLMIERPKNVKVPVPHLKGRVLNETRTLNTLSGYTEIGEIHFEPFDTIITDNEISEIVNLLRTGVIL